MSLIDWTKSTVYGFNEDHVSILYSDEVLMKRNELLLAWIDSSVLQKQLKLMSKPVDMVFAVS